jgi:hypothetical protein
MGCRYGSSGRALVQQQVEGLNTLSSNPIPQKKKKKDKIGR